MGGKTLAIESIKIEFHGKASHAGAAPEEGINALDAAVSFYQMVNSMKQYHPGTNVYGVILESGKKASVIPDYASLHYLLRAWDGETIVKLKKMIEDCAAAAAKMTGCSYELSPIETNNAAMISNAVLSEIFAGYLAEEGVQDIVHSDVRGSTDMGDVSVRIPSIHPWVKLPCNGGALHSREFAEASISEEARGFMKKNACAMALTAAKVISDREILKKIKEEFGR